MPRGSTSTAWFKDLFGFDETSSFSSNQAKFRMEGDELVCETSAFPRQYVGQWETPSLAELRERMAAASAAASGADKPLSFEHLATPVGVQSLIMDPQYAGAVFQAASQFNALEMTGPGVSPRQGVAIYANDPTQGPKCALSCPAATIFRNYLVEGEGGVLGQGDKQVDCLRDVGAVVGNGNDKFWTMKSAPVPSARTRRCAPRPPARLHPWRRLRGPPPSPTLQSPATCFCTRSRIAHVCAPSRLTRPTAACACACRWLRAARDERCDPRAG